MKIGIYDPYLDDLGGGEKYMLTIAECLSRDNDVTIFWDNERDFDTILQRFSIDLSQAKVKPNIFSQKVSFLKRLLESKNFDEMIILSDGSIPLVLSKRLFIHVQQPIVTAERKGIKSLLKRSRITKVFCNSYFSKSFVDEQFGVNSTVIYPPVSLKPQKIKKENLILHVGRFRVRDVRTVVDGSSKPVGDYKKQSVMIGAFKKLTKKIPGWKFVIATGVKPEDEEEFNTMKKLSRDYPIEFLVNKTNDELWDTYSKAKIYWHASGFGEDLEKHPEFAEHFGISTVEAMGAGAVPVVLNAGGQKEIVEDNVSGLLWNSLSELEEKTLLLTKEDEILQKMSAEAVKRAKDFEGERFCDEIKRMVES
ncbi:MAG: glycosyltransferase family 4 protein [Candidatus Levybacteria bacterium]|nr:glycosyltransferase family 4 protein [Candidatus Levybacteria bacterium]